MNFGVVGRFMLLKQKVKVNTEGNIVLDSEGCQIPIGEPWIESEFDNLITNQGLDRVPVGNPIERIYLSTDNREPQVTDSTLSGFLAGSKAGAAVAGETSLTIPPYFVSGVYTADFAAGVGTGNISKIATGWGSDTEVSGLWSVALTKSEGLPTVITKLPDEILTITYTLRTYISEGDFDGAVSISGTTHAVKCRVASLGSWNSMAASELGAVNIIYLKEGGIKDIKSTPTGQSVFFTSLNTLPYVKGSYERGYTVNVDIKSANFPSGINSLQVNGGTGSANYKGFQVSFTPPIMKTSEMTLTTPPFYVVWGRYVAP